MSDTLIAYATDHGQTAKIAGRIAAGLRDAGLDVVTHDVSDASAIDPGGHAAIILGASVHRGHHQRSLVDWVKRHRDALDTVPTAFFSVSLTAADDTDEARAATQKCIDDFVEETGWTPGATARFAGALKYREYDVFTRALMRLIAKHNGGPTDTSHDHELTDWDAVDAFTHGLAARPAPERV